MNYKVLYRKYRPTNFDDIVGQDYIVKTLKNSIINNSIAHAYIFSGPRGTGKTTTAKVFAKAINCVNPVDGSPCGKCDFCLHFQENPDIIDLDAASNNGVDEIRQIIENVKLTPTNGKYKVYIIDEVHMLTQSAFNALLLTLEEPPAHSIFILATTNIECVPVTILSRCQRYNFKKINIETMSGVMKKISVKEEIHIDEAALKEIAYYAEGGMRDALSLLDQLSKSKDTITLEYVEEHLKTISNKTIEDLFDYLEKNDVDNFLNLINEFREKFIDYKTLVKKIIDVASKRAKNIIKNSHVERLGLTDYKKIILDLIESLNNININVDSYTVLEMILLEYFDNEQELSNNKPIVKEEIKEEIKKEKPSFTKEEAIAPESNIAEDLINLRINNCLARAQKKYLEETKKNIDNLLTLSDIPGKIKGILMDSSLVTASDKNLIFSVENEHNAENANKMLKDIELFFNKKLNSDYKIIFLSNNRWNVEKEKYIKNLKNNVKYEYVEEKETNDNQDIINDVFDLSKVEIV